MSQLLLTCGTEPSRRVPVKKLLAYVVLAGQTLSVCAFFKAIERTSQLIQPGVGFERQQRIDVMVRELTIDKRFSPPLDPVEHLQVIVQAGEDRTSQHSLTPLHLFLLLVVPQVTYT
jgi:hypothetical protein